jgi:hypothetical protein
MAFFRPGLHDLSVWLPTKNSRIQPVSLFDPELRLLVGPAAEKCFPVDNNSTWHFNRRAVIGRLMGNLLFCVKIKFTSESSTRTTANREMHNFQATSFHEVRA